MRLIQFLALSTLMITGCSSPKFTYYSLSADSSSQSPLAGKEIRVMVGPVSLPPSIDLPQIVIQGKGNQIEVLEYQRWSGSLKSEIGRVIAANLSQELKISDIRNFTQSTQTNFNYQILIDVQNLQSKLGDSVSVDVLWTIKPSADKNEAKLKMGRSLVSEPVTNEGVQALVDAQSRALYRVSKNIARSMI